MIFVYTRHFGSFTSDKRTVGLPATFGYAGDDFLSYAKIKFSNGEIVEKTEGGSATNDQIINAHGDEIDADSVMLIAELGNYQFCAHAVC